MFGPGEFGRCPRVGKLVRFSLVESHRECLDRRPGHRRHDSGESAGVNATREEKAERNIAHEVTAHRIEQSGPDVPHRLLEGQGRGAVLPRGHMPVLPELNTPLWGPG